MNSKSKIIAPLKSMKGFWHLALMFSCLFLGGLACVNNQDFDLPELPCEKEPTTNASYAMIKELFTGETVQIYEDLIIDGYVISSDEAGNIFGSLYFQNGLDHPSEGFEIALDARNIHLQFPIGSRIQIHLNGLYLDEHKGVYKLGGALRLFGKLSIGRLPYHAIDKHIQLSCDPPKAVVPNKISIDQIQENLINTLVEVENVEFLLEEIENTYAIKDEETKRTLVDCNDRQLTLLNSGFSKFHAEQLPKGKGTIVGILTSNRDEYQLIPRSLDDIDLNEERCSELIDEFSSTQIIISELADPENNTKARFVELYNTAIEPLSLKGWSLRRYTNDKVEIGAVLDLSEFTINGKTTLVLASNATEFQLVYGFAPDMHAGGQSPADSNGDDNLELVDPFGIVIDQFGIPGVDGSGTDHEFEDGRALRKPEILYANNKYRASEWVICNDTGDSGTLNAPKSAPNDYSPGTHN